MIDSVLGLPLHPLVVHAAVVLLPMAALAVLALVFVRRWRRTYAYVVIGLVTVAAGAGFLAKEAGERLAEVTGVPADHERWGDLLGSASVAFFLVSVGWLWWARRDSDKLAVVREVARWASAALSAGILALTVLAGHSGATAVWGDTLATPSPTAPATSSAAPATSSAETEDDDDDDASATGSPAASSTPSRITTPEATTTDGAQQSYAIEDVAAHASADDCWVAIDGFVYDLTEWIPQHPGGSDRIIPVCGTDGTSAFTAQHDSQPEPNQELTRFLLGPLS